MILTRNPVTVDSDTATRYEESTRTPHPDYRRMLWFTEDGTWVIHDFFTDKWSRIAESQALTWLIRNGHEQRAQALLLERGVEFFKEGPFTWPSIAEWEDFSIRLKDGSRITSLTVFPQRAEHWYTPSGVNSTDGPGARRLTARAAARVIISKGPRDWAELRGQPWVWQGDLMDHGHEPWPEGLGLVLGVGRVTALPVEP
ncbi:hypothetical protein MSM1_20070 [Mycobacterium sp. SM1]|uniref:hypothetical protein n=1 Tax=Mycobacterium sp. SM1 TaxID=2816243 RepID=UPI001BCBEEA8|nr:hypothetical protein [Mycobacterium sp. SM1]MBS4730519.1 hypothetical protein [Mycobacterium sp. SM1]